MHTEGSHRATHVVAGGSRLDRLTAPEWGSTELFVMLRFPVCYKSASSSTKCLLPSIWAGCVILGRLRRQLEMKICSLRDKKLFFLKSYCCPHRYIIHEVEGTPREGAAVDKRIIPGDFCSLFPICRYFSPSVSISTTEFSFFPIRHSKKSPLTQNKL